MWNEKNISNSSSKVEDIIIQFKNTVVIYRIFPKEMILNKYFLEKKIIKFKVIYIKTNICLLYHESYSLLVFMSEMYDRNFFYVSRTIKKKHILHVYAWLTQLIHKYRWIEVFGYFKKDILTCYIIVVSLFQFIII